MAVNAKTTPVGDILVAAGRTLTQLNTLVDTNTSDIDALEAAAPVAATETAAGIVELATNVEAVAGADATRAVTPAGVAAAAPNVTLTGTPDYITISGQTVTRNQIDLAADVTGALPIANGGTNATTAADAFANIKVAASETATGVVELATIAEAQTGTDTSRAVTPAGVAAASLSTAANNTLTASPKFWVGTQANYDAIVTKDANTIYDILA